MPRKKQTLGEKRLRAFNPIINPRSAMFYIDYTYDSSYPCSPDGCGGGICRCEVLNNVRITDNVNPEVISYNLVRSVDEGSIYHYCIERLLTLHKIYDVNAWEISVAYGYYGQEVNAVEFVNSNALLDDVKQIVEASDIDAIKFILNKEYGYLLPVIEDCTQATIETINLNTIYKNVNSYHKRVVDCEFYMERTLPMSIVIGEDTYNIIDGWHRYIAKLANNTKKHQVIKLS
jgi:hypothetical protein